MKHTKDNRKEYSQKEKVVRMVKILRPYMNFRLKVGFPDLDNR